MIIFLPPVASLPHVTNLIAGDGSGGASDSGVNAALTGAAINPASIGAGTPGTGEFTTASASGALTLGGNAVLLGDAANTLALRNGANAQTFQIYKTYTDASNFERIAQTFDNTAGYMFTESAGTGVARHLWLGTAGNAELLLGVNGVDRWKLSTLGYLLATNDNTYDIGDGAGHDPRNIYAKGSLTIGGATPIKKVLSATAELDFGVIAGGASTLRTMSIGGATVGSTAEVNIATAAVAAHLTWNISLYDGLGTTITLDAVACDVDASGVPSGLPTGWTFAGSTFTFASPGSGHTFDTTAMVAHGISVTSQSGGVDSALPGILVSAEVPSPGLVNIKLVNITGSPITTDSTAIYRATLLQF